MIVNSNILSKNGKIVNENHKFSLELPYKY